MGALRSCAVDFAVGARVPTCGKSRTQVGTGSLFQARRPLDAAHAEYIGRRRTAPRRCAAACGLVKGVEAVPRPNVLVGCRAAPAYGCIHQQRMRSWRFSACLAEHGLDTARGRSRQEARPNQSVNVCILWLGRKRWPHAASLQVRRAACAYSPLPNSVGTYWSRRR